MFNGKAKVILTHRGEAFEILHSKPYMMTRAEAERYCVVYGYDFGGYDRVNHAYIITTDRLLKADCYNNHKKV